MKARTLPAMRACANPAGGGVAFSYHSHAGGSVVLMIGIRFFEVPARLQPYIERALMIDFTEAVGFRWQFLPTGCFGMSFLVGPPACDYELDRPDEDGTFAGVAPQAMGTWCERACVAFGISFTPFAAVHLPLVAHDFESQFAVHSELLFGRGALRGLRAHSRDSHTPEAKMQVFLHWIEGMLLDRRVCYGRAAAIADVAHAMRSPGPPSIEEAARRAGLQRRQFERDFRRYLGTSPKRYATIARVQQVPQLAWHGLGLATIAAELGFVDQAHMTHVVREVTGMTPHAWLQRAADSDLARQTRPFSDGRITHL
jgi:AraC-like DNA-binding protein